VNREKFSKYSADKLGIVRTGPSVADVAASLAKRGSISESQGGSDSSRQPSVDSASQGALPKQSGFVPRSRKSAAAHDDDEPMPDIPNLLRQQQRQNTSKKNQQVPEQEPATPTQTSFLQRRLQKQREEERRREEADKKRQAEIRAAKEKADDISLKESIAKVKSWKQQLRGASPPEDENSIFGKDDWRKRKTLARDQSTEDAATTTKTQTAKPQTKKFAGVAGFPPADAVADENEANTSRLSAPASGRALSPYDNLKPPRHPPSDSKDTQRAQQPQRLTADAARSKACHQSTDSLSGFNGDISASSEDDESGIARTQSINSLEESDSWPPARSRARGYVTSSLPDLVTSSQSGRRRTGGEGGSFIGGVRDIDSLLGFGETEDELEVKSDDDDEGSSSSSSSSDDSDSAESFATSHERQQQQQEQFRGDTGSARRTTTKSAHADDSLVGQVEDIDDILGTDLVPSHLGSSSVTERPAVTQTTNDSMYLVLIFLYIS